jgi:hypothetical protein
MHGYYIVDEETLVWFFANYYKVMIKNDDYAMDHDEYRAFLEKEFKKALKRTDFGKAWEFDPDNLPKDLIDTLKRIEEREQRRKERRKALKKGKKNA